MTAIVAPAFFNPCALHSFYSLAFKNFSLNQLPKDSAEEKGLP
ncbi:hypothetical protein CKC_03250 [Candidatus Liberibacter solanacearum CLso-ZC1]|uniref:Uncharacterized protein n=1 Tax=Liberibacter solanacearum (strain CLso-ZC1) TaxID=658172 RepID=E4UB08_LIBSC|nr:hypothetical protein [Candidatus Liberibacter solanacearum]ADR52399.1 hypothetical protein CKC_03250 [Candidatus Liberibacter solanacearum CLso-ZC1]